MFSSNGQTKPISDFSTATNTFWSFNETDMQNKNNSNSHIFCISFCCQQKMCTTQTYYEEQIGQGVLIAAGVQYLGSNYRGRGAGNWQVYREEPTSSSGGDPVKPTEYCTHVTWSACLLFFMYLLTYLHTIAGTNVWFATKYNLPSVLDIRGRYLPS